MYYKTLDKYSGVIDTLKDYIEFDYITNIGHMTKNILLKILNNSNIFFMNISSLIFESLDLLTKSLNRLIIGVY